MVDRDASNVEAGVRIPDDPPFLCQRCNRPVGYKENVGAYKVRYHGLCYLNAILDAMDKEPYNA